MRRWPTESMRAKRLLRGRDGLVVEVADQRVGRGPRFFVGLPHDDVQADAEGEAAPLACGRGADGGDFLGDLRRRLAPGEVLVDRFGRDIDASIRRAAEIERRSVFLQRSEGKLGALDGEVLSALGDFLARQQAAVDAEELGCDGIAFVVVEEDAIALALDRIAARHHIDQQTSAG